MSKRGRHDGGDPSSKRARSEYELRLLIHFKAAGAIIGKGGENVKRFREMEDIDDISLPDRRSPERILFICGKNMDALTKCLDTMFSKLDEINHKHVGVSPSESEVRMLVHGSQVGAIIGKAGYKIKELKEQTNAEMKVYHDRCPRSTDRVIRINGTQEEVVNCVGAMLRIMEESPPKGPWDPYDSENFDPGVADMYGGFTDPSFRAPMGGMGMDRMGDRGYGSMGGMGRDRYGGMDAGGRSGGFDDYGGRSSFGGRGDGYGRFDDYGSDRNGFGGRTDSFGGRTDNFGRGGREDYGAYGSMGGGGSMRGVGGAVRTNQVTVPDEVAGVIIGRRGETIWDIRNRTGAEVEIDKTATSDGQRIISIRGDEQQIQMAQQMLQQAVRSSPQGRQFLQRMGV